MGGKPCVCHIHPPLGAAEGAAERAAACLSWEEAERAALEEGGGSLERWEAAVAEREVAEAEAAAAAAKVARADKYDNMFASVETLMATLFPCGKISHPELSIIGASEFSTYKRRCVHDDCENRIWRRREACGFEAIFGKPCPTETTADETEWRSWQKRLRGVNDEGKEFHSMEWLPAYGERRELWAELLPAIRTTLPHIWRHELMSQSVRVYEDRKSGRHRDKLRERLHQLATPRVMADAFRAMVELAEATLVRPVVASPPTLSRMLCTLRAVRRLADIADLPPEAAVADARSALQTAEQVFDVLSRTGTFQSDYASQLETSRIFHATCATKERHNYLVTLVGYRSRTEARARPRKSTPRRWGGARPSPYDRPASEGGGRSAGYARRDERQTVDYKQNTDVRRCPQARPRGRLLTFPLACNYRVSSHSPRRASSRVLDRTT